MKTFQASQLSRAAGDVLTAADRNPVTLTKHRKPRYVILNIEDYNEMKERDQRPSTQRSFKTSDIPEPLLSQLIEGLESDDI